MAAANRWRRAGPTLVAVGVLAIALHTGRFRAIDAWGIVFVGCTAIGSVLWLRRFSGGRWMVASLPFWAFAGAHDLFQVAAFGLVLTGLVIVAVGPTLPSRRIARDATPLPHLSHGPLVPVAARVCFGGQRSRWLSGLAWAFAVIAVLLAGWAGSGRAPIEVAALGIASAIIGGTFAFSNWFAGRVRLRIDEHGLHSRTLFTEHTIRWNEVAGLTIRYVFLPGYSIRLVYYVAYSPTREFAFTSRMPGARDLQRAIQDATGLEWPVPAVEGNF